MMPTSIRCFRPGIDTADQYWTTPTKGSSTYATVELRELWNWNLVADSGTGTLSLTKFFLNVMAATTKGTFDLLLTLLLPTKNDERFIVLVGVGLQSCSLFTKKDFQTLRKLNQS